MIMNVRDRFDYINGMHKISDKTVIKSDSMITLQKIDIKVADVRLSIIAIKQARWTFIYNSRSDLWKLLQVIVKGEEIANIL